MSNINVHGHMSKKRIVRNMRGEIIDLLDEADGGWIIRGGRVVNQEKIDELAKKEEDKRVAAQAQAEQVVHNNVPDRTVAPSKVDELEKRVSDIDDKLDAILKALKK